MTQQARFDFWNYLAPKYWGTWLGLGFMRLIAFLPFSLQRVLCHMLAKMYYLLAKRRRHIAEVNINLCFPDLSEQQRSKLVKDAFFSSAMGFIELVNAWWASDNRLKDIVTVYGLEHLEEARNKNKGILIIGAHYTTVQLSGRLMSFYAADLQPLYKKAHNKLFDAIMTRIREKTFKEVLPNNSINVLVERLKQNKVCWYAPDQDFGKEATVFAPFFNVQTACLVVPAVLARISGATVLSMYSQRLDNGKYLLEISPVDQPYPAKNNIESATTLNKILERNILRAPDQYLWLHRRFKTRPPGEDDVY